MVKFIINADDFGASRKVDEAILDLIKKDCISSVSVIIKKIAKESIEKLKILRKEKNISVGLHFFNYPYEGEKDFKKIMEELERQYIDFMKFFGFRPSHLDKHNWEKSKDEFKALCEFSIKKDMPVRLHKRGKYYEMLDKYDYKNKIKITEKQYNLTSKKYGINLIKKDIKDLKSRNIICEVIAHPGFYDRKYNAKEIGTKLNKKREKDYQNVLELKSFLEREGIPIVPYSIL